MSGDDDVTCNTQIQDSFPFSYSVPRERQVKASIGPVAFIDPPGNTFCIYALHVVHIALRVLRYTYHKTGKVQDREAYAGVSPSQASASVLAGEL